jgi:hypothetical protein
MYEVKTAKINSGKCKRCKEAIIKGEGILKVRSYRYCFRCGTKWIEDVIKGWDRKKDLLKVRNQRSERVLKAQKMVRKI